jgi:hypothetical protein
MPSADNLPINVGGFRHLIQDNFIEGKSISKGIQIIPHELTTSGWAGDHIIERNTINGTCAALNIERQKNVTYRNNTINNTVYVYPPSYAIRIKNSSDQYFYDMIISNSGDNVWDIYMDTLNSNIRFINTTFNSSKVYFADNNDQIQVYNYLNTYVVNHSLYSQYVYNVTGVLIDEASTTSGKLNKREIREYVRNKTTTKQDNPYLVKINGFSPNADLYVTIRHRDGVNTDLGYAQANSTGWLAFSITKLGDITIEPGISFKLNLNEGWNLISIPLINNSFTAESFASAIGNSNVKYILKRNSTMGIYQGYIVGFGGNRDNFDIRPDIGYFVYSVNQTTFSISGGLPKNRSINLVEGWNLIGWTSLNTSTATKAFVEPLGDKVRYVTKRNNVTGEYQTYVAGFSGIQGDFAVEPGHGYFVYVTSNCTLVI